MHGHQRRAQAWMTLPFEASTNQPLTDPLPLSLLYWRGSMYARCASAQLMVSIIQDLCKIAQSWKQSFYERRPKRTLRKVAEHGMTRGTS
jgi:hypothetical protein